MVGVNTSKPKGTQAETVGIKQKTGGVKDEKAEDFVHVNGRRRERYAIR